MIEEIWRPCLNFEEHYEVSSTGRVRRMLKCRGAVPGRILKPFIDKDGYHNLILSKDNILFNTKAHILVCMTWHGPKPSLEHEVCHFDGDPGNNTPKNLRWDTSRGNTSDMLRHGKLRSRKLTEEKVKLIKNLYKKDMVGAGAYVLAKQFDVSTSTIYAIVNNKVWNNV